MSINKMDESKLLQTITGFSLAILLSLCSRVATNLQIGDENINSALWVACGLFASASIRFLDKAYDDFFSDEIGILSFNHKNKTDGSSSIRYLISIDQRWLRTSFLFTIIGWIYFLTAYFHIACMIYHVDKPSSMFNLWGIITLNWETRFVGLLAIYSTVRTATKQFIFHD